MDLQEKYDKLDNIISTCRSLIDEIEDYEMRDYIERLEEIQFDAQNELDEIEPQLQEMYDKEEREQNIEYERSVI